LAYSDTRHVFDFGQYPFEDETYRNSLVMKDIILSGICRKCAECCKNYPFVELSESEIELLEKVTGLHFGVFTNPKRKTIEEYFLKFKENGYCFFLNENDDTYCCRVYESRPEICRNFPSTLIQKKACHEYLENR
jgi:Fe-S-cluster containining protein